MNTFLDSQLIIPQYEYKILTPEQDPMSGYTQEVLCKDDPNWAKNNKRCIDYSIKDSNCSDIGDNGISALNACKVSCDNCPGSVQIEKRIPSAVEDVEEPDYALFEEYEGDDINIIDYRYFHDTIDELNNKIADMVSPAPAPAPAPAPPAPESTSSQSYLPSVYKIQNKDGINLDITQKGLNNYYVKEKPDHIYILLKGDWVPTEPIGTEILCKADECPIYSPAIAPREGGKSSSPSSTNGDVSEVENRVQYYKMEVDDNKDRHFWETQSQRIYTFKNNITNEEFKIILTWWHWGVSSSSYPWIGLALFTWPLFYAINRISARDLSVHLGHVSFIFACLVLGIIISYFNLSTPEPFWLGVKVEWFEIFLFFLVIHLSVSFCNVRRDNLYHRQERGLYQLLVIVIPIIFYSFHLIRVLVPDKDNTLNRGPVRGLPEEEVMQEGSTRPSTGEIISLCIKMFIILALPHIIIWRGLNNMTADERAYAGGGINLWNNIKSLGGFRGRGGAERPDSGDYWREMGVGGNPMSDEPAAPEIEWRSGQAATPRSSRFPSLSRRSTRRGHRGPTNPLLEQQLLSGAEAAGEGLQWDPPSAGDYEPPTFDLF